MYSGGTLAHFRVWIRNMSRVNTPIVQLKRGACDETDLSPPRGIEMGILPFYCTYLFNSMFRECCHLLKVGEG